MTMRFEDYLSEAFGTRPVDFGTNHEANNGQFESFAYIVSTSFIYRDNRFRVGYSKDDGTISFVNRTSGDNRITAVRETRTGLDFYNRIAYVVMKLLEHAKAKTFRFEGESDDLKHLYSKIVANPSFQRMIKTHGWQYHGQKYEGLFLFKRK